MSDKDETPSPDIDALLEEGMRQFRTIGSRILQEAERTGSSFYFVSYGDDRMILDGPLQVFKPRTRRERLADWWEYRVLLRIEYLRVRLARRIRSIADWFDPYCY